MKLLITGATGFIGGHLVERLINKKHRVHSLVRPKSKTSALRQAGVTVFRYDGKVEKLTTYMKQQRFDGVIHLASMFLAKHKPEDIKSLIESNVLFGTSVLEAAAASKIPWFLNTGTFWQHYQNKSYSPVNLYSATKEAFEDIAQYYLEASSMNVVTLKLIDTFGPGDTRPKIFNLWAKIAKSGERLDMSPGNQKIDISYIDNVIDAYERLMKLVAKDTKRKLGGKSFAVRSNEVMPLRQLAKVFEEVTNTTLNIRWGKRPYRPREVMLPWSTGKRVPGWIPKVSLRQGIRKTFNE